jgi:hypothetical protein
MGFPTCRSQRLARITGRHAGQRRGGRNNRRTPRIEALEARCLLAASVATDKLDYAPGDTAYISGRGFFVGETVELTVRMTWQPRRSTTRRTRPATAPATN